MLGTVDELATPNERLAKLNKLFEEITMLDQQQRAEAIQNPEKPYKYFLDQTGYLHLLIDSVLMLPWDSVQASRLASLKVMLDERNALFVSYLKVRAELSNNHEFSNQLDTLSALLKESQKRTDSVVTRQTQTITKLLKTDSAKTEKSEKGFLKRLFGKRKRNAADSSLALRKEVIIDTVSVAKQAVDFDEVRKIMKDLKSDHNSKRRNLERKELEMIHMNSLFINELLNTLHEVQNEEMAYMQKNTAHASSVVSAGISRMTILLLCFFLGAAVLVYLIFIDISNSNFYKRQLEKARDEAQELSKIKQRFLANMSHEIRTPLQSIVGFAEQLRTSETKNRDSVEAIHSSSEHLLHIVNEVLDYTRISSGTFSLSKDDFRLFKVVKEVESAMRIQAERKNLTFVLDAEKASDAVVNGDPFRLRQILYNLLGNAIKFTESGYVRLAVRTYNEEDSIRTVFEITDTGIGMSDEELKHVFNQFEQANHNIARNYGGTGLGLTIVKSLVEVQNGKLDVKSELGKGSTFKVVLNFSKSSEKNKVVSNLDKPTSRRQVNKVLVIDDDTMILKLCALILTKNKIDHQTFNDPTLLVTKEFDPAVSHILIDIRMPKMNGLEVCERLRLTYGADTKFIALTAHVLPEEKAALLDAGFDLVLNKPFHESELLKVLDLAKASEKLKTDLPDFAVVRQMTMGDEMLFQMVLQQFLEDSESDVERLETAADNLDGKQVRESVHKLAGRFGQMGIYKIAGTFHDLEVRLVAGASADEILNELHAVLEETKDLLRQIRLTNIEHLN